MSKLLDFFKEENGSYSIMRLVFFIFSMNAVWACDFMLIKDTANWSGAIAIFTALAGTAITGKLIQKPMEASADKPV